MNKVIIIGIVASVIILGILAISLLDSSSIIDDNEEQKRPFLETGDDEKKPQGRDLSIELDEKMGLSAP